MRARGFTLLELMISLSISIVGIAAAFYLLVATQRWYRTGADDRGMQEAGRVALEELRGSVAMAGYGLEPAFAFDVGKVAPTPSAAVPASVAGSVRFGGYCPGTGGCVRDRIDGPDELVFYSRDPLWERDVLAVDAFSNRITVAPPKSGNETALYKGQVLQVMCYGTNNQWIQAYVTVASVDRSNPAAIVIQLNTSPTALPFDFPYQNTLLAQPCYQNPVPPPSPSVRAFKIDRYRYHVAAIDPAGKVQAWETAGTQPYLMLDQGLLDDNGKAIDLPVAANVEDLQVAYVFPRALAEKVLGATPGTPVLADDGGIDPGVFDLAPGAPYDRVPTALAPESQYPRVRTSHHPANVRSLRVAVTVRSPLQDAVILTGSDVVPAALNRPALPGEMGYRRLLLETTISTGNTLNLVPTFPAPDKAGVTDCLSIDKTDPALGLTPAQDGNCGGG